MAFEGLADKLANSFKRLRSKGKLSESDVKAAMREVRLALLEARFLGTKRVLYPKLRLTIADMILQGPPQSR